MRQIIYPSAYECLTETDPVRKVELTQNVARQWRDRLFEIDDDKNIQDVIEPGRPKLPRLIEPYLLPQRTPGTFDRHLALMHAIAHIEFNAINLAWDAVYRFRGMPYEYYSDWIRVADEEAYHFSLITQYLHRVGNIQYGDFDAHDGLWKLALATTDDVMVRMALVPRVMEARGLDVTPDMIKRLNHHGYADAVAILEIIYRDEIGHVEIGTRWFEYCCAQRGLESQTVFRELVETRVPDRIRPPINNDARKKAGFTDPELEFLHGML